MGAAIEFASGTIFRAVIGDGVVWDHPSTGQPLIGERIPHWRQAVETARRCSGALGLGYVRVDIVIDAARGAQVLECNAYPGLVIQNVNTAGLAGRIAQVEQQKRDRDRERALRLAAHRHRYTGFRPLHRLGGAIRTASGRVVEAWTLPASAA